MRRRLTARAERFALARPFAIARGVRHAVDLVTVAIADGPCVGRGEGSPSARYGEDAVSALDLIARAQPAIEAGASRSDLLGSMPAGAARAAVDAALWELEAALEGLPVASRLGGRPAGVATAMTIGLDSPAAMAAQASTLADLPLLKVKLGADDPAGRLAAVRGAAPRAALMVDANESWTPAVLAAMIPELERARVRLLEQPLPAGDDAALADVRAALPIVADESAHVAADVPGLASRYQGVCIKLDKSGGLTEALAMADAARRAGMLVMAGCMIGSSLGLAPAFHLAARSDVADLDGPSWLAADRAGGATFTGGSVHLRPDF